jgi:hypothetical protein
LGWSSSSPEDRQAIVEKFLGHARPDIEPDYTAVLVCEKCGDIGCGAFVVRIIENAEQVRWSDWNWAGSDREIQPLVMWAQKPEEFVFSRGQYEFEFRQSLADRDA